MKAKHLISMATLGTMAACTAPSDGSYGSDLSFFTENGIETAELVSKDASSRVMIVPAWQARVMTSTTGGLKGRSYGWINRKFISSGEVNPQFNSFGGEERFWIGPEGGPFSFYFPEGAEQVYANWKVPAVLDTEAFETEDREEGSASFVKRTVMRNASGTGFRMTLRRKISLENAAAVLGTDIPEGISALAYSTANSISNEGTEAWTKETGLPSIWLLGTLNPTPTTTVFIPYREDCPGRIVKDDYFGELPEERICVKDGMVYFKIDGEYRAKIGLPRGSAKDLCGSYDSANHVLNILKYTVPEGPCDYVNSQWGHQDDHFGGDVINSYNDGPTDTGVIMGPFYEIETSSPGAALGPGETLTHTQYTLHFEGPEEKLSAITEAVFGVSLKTVAGVFR